MVSVIIGFVLRVILREHLITMLQTKLSIRVEFS